MILYFLDNHKRGFLISTMIAKSNTKIFVFQTIPSIATDSAVYLLNDN